MTLPEHNFLKTVIEALRNDVPKRDYSKLSKYTVQHARKDLIKLLEAVPGANFENVKFLRAQLSIAEQGSWTQLNSDIIEDAALEYFVLVKVGTETKEKQEQEKRLKELNKTSKKPEEPQMVTKDITADSGVTNDVEDYPEPGLKKVDTAELLLRQKEQEKTDADNEDVPMPTIKHVDTAELLIMRRSKEAGIKLRDGNASITNLGDPNRPTKIAEMYTQLYDNEWTDALETLTKHGVPEIKAIETLLGYLQTAFQNCRDEVEQKKSQLKGNDTEQSITDILKSVTDDQMNDLQKFIGDKVIGDNNNQIMRSYVDECVRLSYLMNVQDPPMALHEQNPGEMFSSSHFKEYTRAGQTVEYLVWPALLLHENGPVAAKGIVQLQ